MSALLLALHTGLRTKVTHISSFFVRTFHIYIYRERERENFGSAGLLTLVSTSAVPYSTESEERI